MLKKLTLIAALLPAIVFTACKKDSTDTTAEYYVNAKKNNSSWRSVDASASKMTTNDTVSIFARAIPSGTKLPEETFRLSIPSFKPGTYEAVRKNTTFWNTLGLDAITSEFKMADKLYCPVTITEYNAAEKTIKGTFYVSLTKSYPAATVGEKLEMTEGTFYVQFKEY